MKNRTVQVPNIEGVLSVEGRHDTRDVTISWNSEKTNWQEIEGLMRQINYPPAS